MSKFFLLFLCRLRERKKLFILSLTHFFITSYALWIKWNKWNFLYRIKDFLKAFPQSSKVKNIHTAELTTFLSSYLTIQFIHYCVMWLDSKENTCCLLYSQVQAQVLSFCTSKSFLSLFTPHNSTIMCGWKRMLQNDVTELNLNAYH